MIKSVLLLVLFSFMNVYLALAFAVNFSGILSLNLDSAGRNLLAPSEFTSNLTIVLNSKVISIIALAVFVFLEIVLLLILYRFRKKRPEERESFQIADTATYGSAMFAMPAEVLENMEVMNINQPFEGITLGEEIDVKETERVRGLADKFYHKKLNDVDRLEGTDDLFNNLSPEEKKVMEAEGEISQKSVVGNGRVVSLKDVSGYNKNIFVVGPPGTFKSTSFCATQIFQCVRSERNFIMTDTKGEMYELFKNYLEGCGYKVYLFNTKDPTLTHGWNPLHALPTFPDERDKILDDLVTSLVSVDPANAYWDNNAKFLFSAVVKYVVNAKGIHDKDRNFKKVIDMLLKSEDEIIRIIGNSEPISPEYSSYLSALNVFKQAPEQNRSNIVVGLNTKLSNLHNRSVMEMLSRQDIDFDQFDREKSCVFVVISDQDETNQYLASMFLNRICTTLSINADNNVERTLPDGTHYKPRIKDKHLNYETLLILDEFVNLGLLGFNKKLSTMRSRGIPASVIVQSISQLSSRFGIDEAKELIGSCDTILVLGSNEDATSNLISNLTGEATVIQRSDASSMSHGVSKGPARTSESESTGEGRRVLITPHEVRTMPKMESIVIRRGLDAFKVKKLPYWKHPDYKKLTAKNIATGEPAYPKANIVEFVRDENLDKDHFEDPIHTSSPTVTTTYTADEMRQMKEEEMLSEEERFRLADKRALEQAQKAEREKERLANEQVKRMLANRHGPDADINLKAEPAPVTSMNVSKEDLEDETGSNRVAIDILGLFGESDN